jgi:hypothetical protein
LNPRPLGYEPYDMCLPRLGPSPAGVVTSADRTDPVSLRRFRLPRLVRSRRVRFTNRFTEEAIDLQFPAPLRTLPWLLSLGAGPCPDSPSDCQAAASTRDASPLVVSDTGPRGAPVVITANGSTPEHRPYRCLSRPLPRTRLPPDLTADGFCPRVGVADHAVTPKAPWTGSGWREYSYSGFGGGHPPFRPHNFCRQPCFSRLDYQLGKLCRPGMSQGLTCGTDCPGVTVRDPSSLELMAR